MKLPVTAVVINYQTPDLLEVAVRSFRRYYPMVPLLIVDNGSRDHSRQVIEQLIAEGHAAVRALWLPENIYHGPAMHRAMEAITTPYVYFFDSDTETRRGGFLEPMIAALEADPQAYGAGRIVEVDRRRGFRKAGGLPVLATPYLLLRRAFYFRLPPFIHHGLPTLQNFRAAEQAGYRLVSFPIETYVHHLGRGTAARYGYGLGWRSRLEYLLHRLGL
ncbi:glycosyltransferase family 2 protein [Rhodothermus profundi]|uniref:Glycosyl transferase family 2 n=1 Tax=Rhodothermus profundi TaxID=633813 RepID=A0A1M6UI24_9BACT|nr:glycosyltransferase family 2 protein [Rhodothermus profundi]SHK68803.1 Glycosyl transferase family 2 [Rhodothermus profundi]